MLYNLPRRPRGNEIRKMFIKISRGRWNLGKWKKWSQVICTTWWLKLYALVSWDWLSLCNCYEFGLICRIGCVSCVIDCNTWMPFYYNYTFCLCKSISCIGKVPGYIGDVRSHVSHVLRYIGVSFLAVAFSFLAKATLQENAIRVDKTTIIANIVVFFITSLRLFLLDGFMKIKGFLNQ